MNKIIAALAMIFIFSIVIADTRDTTTNLTPHFAPTYPINRNEVRFKPFEKIVWKTLAPDWVKSINIKKPSRQVLKKLNDLKGKYIEPGITRINQERPLPKEIKNRLYYLITDRGVISALPKRLVASTLFYLNDEGTVINEVEYDGNVVAGINNQEFHVGFVMNIENSGSIKVKVLEGDAELNFKAVHKDNTITFSYDTGKSTLQISKENYSSIDIKTVYAFSLGDSHSKYILLVRGLNPNVEDCHTEYSLFRIETGLEEILTEQTDCTYDI